MARETWAIVTGALRESLEFKLNLAHLVDLRRNGLLDGIILSTWRGEIDRIEGLRDALRVLGVDTVESDDPRDPGPPNNLRQHKSFYHGLELAPPSARVLRWRTDKVMKFIPSLQGALRRDFVDEPSNQFSEVSSSLYKVFDEPVRVLSLAVSFPFHHIDLTMLGAAADLRRMVNFDSRLGALYGMDAAEIRWFASPFLSRCPLFETLFRVTNAYALSEAIVFHARDAQQNFRLPHFLNCLYAAYFHFCYFNYASLEASPGARRAEGDLQLFELFAPPRSGDRWPGLYYLPSSSTTHDRGVFATVLGGGLAPSDGAVAFMEAVTQIQNGAFPEFGVDEARDQIAQWLRDAAIPVNVLNAQTVTATRSERMPSGDFCASLRALGADRDTSSPELGGLEAFLAASDNGLSLDRAAFAVAQRYLSDSEDHPRDAEKGAQWLKRANAWGSAAAHLELAKLFLDGDGVAQDTHFAVMHHLRYGAMYPEEVEAQYLYGVCLLEGYALPQDQSAGFYWLHGAAGRGHRDAQLLTARCLEKGVGVEPDAAAAAYWRERAAAGAV